MRARQRFWQIPMLVIVLLLSVSFIPLLSAGAAGSPDHVTLTWTADPKTTQTITWRTGSTIVGGQVEYVEADDIGRFPGNARTATADIAALQTNLGDMAIHSVTLSGLKPGTKYIYRVGESDGWSEPRTFTTEAAVALGFKFLVFGDSQSVNYGLWRATLTQAYKANSDAAFFTNVGDLVDVGQDYSHWNRWFDAAQGIADTIAVMPITGNHENYTPERRFSLPVFFTAQFKLPPNGPAGLV
ncbi:MAG: FN3 domain-containing metallophosphoesterase family protein, partial [Sporomusa sp.]